MNRVPLSAIVAIARVELRQRWRGLVVLGVFAGFVGGVVLASVTAARRTGTAYERLETATRTDDARLQVFAGADVARRVVTLPPVRRGWVGNFAVGKLPGEEISYVGVMSGPARDELLEPVLVSGRMYREDSPEEVVVTEPFSRSAGAEPGRVISLRFLTSEEFRRFDTGFGEPDGPKIPVRVTGVVRLPATADLAPVLASSAFATRYGEETTVGHVDLLQLNGGRRAIPQLGAALDGLRGSLPPPPPGAEEFAPFDVSYPSEAAATVDATARMLVTGLTVVAVAAVAAGLLALALAFSRHASAGAAEQAVEAALGVPWPGRVLARVVPALVTAAIASAGTAAAGLAAAWLEPIGSVSRYEPHPGWAPNVVLVVAGALMSAAMVLALAAASAYRAGARKAEEVILRPNPLAEGARVVGARPPLLIGLRLAFEAGKGRAAAPVRSSLIGSVVAVAGLVAAATFAASLHRLVTTPARYGWPADFALVDVTDPIIEEMVTDGRLPAVAVVASSSVRLAGRQVPGYSLDVRKGSVDWTMLEGHVPGGPDEVALGSRAARQLDRGPGDQIELVDRDGVPRQMRVVGVGLWPSLNQQLAPGVGVAFSPEGLDRFAEAEGFRGALAVVDAPDAVRVIDEFAARFEVERPERPVDVENLGELRDIPALVAAFVVVLGVATLGHAVVMTVRRRRRDLAVLRAMGFTPGQTGSAVILMAVTTVLVGLLFGVPLGLVGGKLLWRTVAEGVAVGTDVLAPVAVLALVGPAGVVVALVLSALPAWRAARLHPGPALHSE